MRMIDNERSLKMNQQQEAPLNVALVSTQTNWRGGEEQTRLLLHGLLNRGHRVSLLAQNQSAIATRLADEGIEVTTFKGRGRSAIAMWKIRKALKAIRPDVLHYNDSHALTGAGIASLGLPIAARVIARRVNFSINSPWRYQYFADRMICVSNSVKQVCKDAGLPNTNLSVVHDGVEPQRMHRGNRQRGPQSLELEIGQPLILTVAALSEDKGHTYLLTAVASIIEQYPNACVALAGEGHLKEQLEQEAKQLGIEQNVRFLGFRDDIADLIHAADLFVMPSVVEGLCSTLIDVMMAGCPIVATTAGGIPELIGYLGDEPPVGWMVPPRDSHQLSQAILDAMASPRLRELNNYRAIRRAEKQFTMDQMVESTLAVYRDVIGQQTHQKNQPLAERKAA